MNEQDAQSQRSSVHEQRLAALRSAIAEAGLTGFLLPVTDEYLNEYIHPHYDRVAWLTGFTGTRGLVGVLRDEAAIFVDFRYTLRIADEVDPALFAFQDYDEPSVPDKSQVRWFAEHLGPGDRLGFDGRLHSVANIQELSAAIEATGATLVPTDGNPLDALWTDRPPAPSGPAFPHGIAFAGEAAGSKCARVAAAVAEQGCDAAIVTALDSIAWLLNIRGSDMPYSPLVYCSAIVHADGSVDLFIEGKKAPPSLCEHLPDLVRLHEPCGFDAAAAALSGRVVLVDPGSLSYDRHALLRRCDVRLIEAMDPCALPKALKNGIEQQGARTAQLRDAVVLCRFLAWLDREAGGGQVDEASARAQLEACRREAPGFRGLSFATTSAYGANGAIIHYELTPRSCAVFQPGNLYLSDSGAQYPEGTTDITRTVAIGTPSAEMRDLYTRVLKGHVAIATCRFAHGTKGAQLETLIRPPLWEVGLDAPHGVGHGVGSYLNVHEGPQSIQAKGAKVALAAGMICTNEPGYYKVGEFGIRLENMIIVQEVVLPGVERTALEFETITLVPFDRRLIDPELLTAAERDWVDAYHARVAAEISPLLDPDTRQWLIEACAPLRVPV
jgi:Xaa-Pro aminopeptidase